MLGKFMRRNSTEWQSCRKSSLKKYTIVISLMLQIQQIMSQMICEGLRNAKQSKICCTEEFIATKFSRKIVCPMTPKKYSRREIFKNRTFLDEPTKILIYWFQILFE